MIPISVCIIAKNEENYIDECLRRLSAFDWEIIVVDTGSTDNTVNIARNYTPNVYHFNWINDFSAARNYSIAQASNDYILVVDCDEYLEKNNTTSELIQNLPKQIAASQVGVLHRLSPSAEGSEVHEHIARFFNRNYIHYKGSIHEQLVPLAKEEIEFIPIPLSFYHIGYSTIDIKKKKAFRNITMLEKELLEKGADPYIYFQLGQSYFGLEDYKQALPYFENALAMEVNEHEEYVQTLVESYGYSLLYLKQYSRALELESIYPFFSKRADFVFLMGLVYMNNTMFESAIKEFLKATTISDYAVDGVNSYSAYYNAGVIYECMGKIDEAIQYYKKCGNYSPALQRINAIKQ